MEYSPDSDKMDARMMANLRVHQGLAKGAEKKKEKMCSTTPPGTKKGSTSWPHLEHKKLMMEWTMLYLASFGFLNLYLQ